MKQWLKLISSMFEALVKSEKDGMIHLIWEWFIQTSWCLVPEWWEDGAGRVVLGSLCSNAGFSALVCCNEKAESKAFNWPVHLHSNPPYCHIVWIITKSTRSQIKAAEKNFLLYVDGLRFRVKKKLSFIVRKSWSQSWFGHQIRVLLGILPLDMIGGEPWAYPELNRGMIYFFLEHLRISIWRVSQDKGMVKFPSWTVLPPRLMMDR